MVEGGGDEDMGDEEKKEIRQRLVQLLRQRIKSKLEKELKLIMDVNDNEVIKQMTSQITQKIFNERKKISRIFAFQKIILIATLFLSLFLSYCYLVSYFVDHLPYIKIIRNNNTPTIASVIPSIFMVMICMTIICCCTYISGKLRYRNKKIENVIINANKELKAKNNNLTIENEKLKQKNRELEENAKPFRLAQSHERIKFITTICCIIAFIGLLCLYWYFQDKFALKLTFENVDFEKSGLTSDYAKLILILTTKIPFLIFLFVGILICKRFFKSWDEKIELNALMQYKDTISDPVKRDELMMTLAPNYFGTKRGSFGSKRYKRSEYEFIKALRKKHCSVMQILPVLY